MTDDQIEASLRRFRPAGPPSGLRDRTLATAYRSRRVDLGVFDWALIATAAALLLMVANRAPATTDKISTVRAELVQDLAASLGNGDDAKRLAEVALASELAGVKEGVQ